MTENCKLLTIPRSREPIDTDGVICWNMFSEINNISMETKNLEEQKHSSTVNDEIFEAISLTEPKTKHKSTSTENNIAYHKIKATERVEPKDEVLRKWRERKSKSTYELARKAIINSIKEKFGNVAHSGSCADIDKVGNGKDIPTIIVTNADVEDTSNSNVNQNEVWQIKRDFISVGCKSDVCGMQDDSVGHASRLQMGPGGALAQWRLAAHGSRAAGAVGGLRGISKEEMPIMMGLNPWRRGERVHYGDAPWDLLYSQHTPNTGFT